MGVPAREWSKVDAFLSRTDDLLAEVTRTITEVTPLLPEDG